MDTGTKRLFGIKRSFLLVAVVVAAAIGIAAFIFLRQTAAAHTYFTEAVQRGPIRNVVNATGTVQAVLTVQVGSQISGQIQALYADYNSTVRRGQLLARIDPRNFEAQVEQARANVMAAQARVQTTEAELKNQLANLESSKANLEATRVARDNTAQIFRRFTELQQGGIVSQNDFDSAKANSESAAARYAQAAAAVEQVQAQINSGRAQIEQAKAQAEQAKAALNQAEVNLAYSNIYSPVDGVVVSRNVDVGQTVAASLQAPILFLIANDLTQMQVNANIDEADIGNISHDSDARFTVDAYPNRNFTGRISEIRLNPQTIQNVVTYSVIMNVNNERLELKPGMTANLTITVAQENDVLKVPNAALRYLPPGTTRQQVAEMLRRPPEVKGSGLSDLPTEGGAGNQSRARQGAVEQPRQVGKNSLESDERPKPAQPSGATASSPEERRAFFRQMQDLPPNLSEAERQRMQENFRQLGGGTGAGAGTGRRFQAQTPGAATGDRGAAPAAGLAPGQNWDPAEKIQFPAPRQRASRPGIVWALGAGNKPEPRQVLLGITDGSATEVVSGELKETEKVVVGDTSEAAPNGAQAGRPPGSANRPFVIPFGGGGGGRR